MRHACASLLIVAAHLLRRVFLVPVKGMRGLCLILTASLLLFSSQAASASPGCNFINANHAAYEAAYSPSGSATFNLDFDPGDKISFTAAITNGGVARIMDAQRSSTFFSTSTSGSFSYTFLTAQNGMAFNNGGTDIVVFSAISCVAGPVPLAPTITSLSPSGALSTLGSTLTITGANFTGATVELDGASVTHTIDSNSQIRVTLPVRTTTSNATLTITTADGTASRALSFARPTPSFYIAKDYAGDGTVQARLVGTGFAGSGNVVKFDGVTAAIVSESTTNIVVTPPAHAAGLVPVQLERPDGFVQSYANAYQYVAAPTIASVTPAVLSPNGGDTIVITGTNLDYAQVTLGGATIYPGQQNSTTYRFNAPLKPAGSYSLELTTEGGRITRTITYAVGAPRITGATGNAARTGQTPGTLNIYGVDLLGATNVTIGGVGVSSFTVLGNTQINAVPRASSSSGMGEIVVTTPQGSSIPDSNSRYAYLGLPTSAIANNAVLTSGAVTFSGTGVPGARVNSSSLLDSNNTNYGGFYVTVDPSGNWSHSRGGSLPNGQYRVELYQDFGGVTGDSMTLNFRVDTTPAPTITAISPASGTLGGGTPVTITGTGFVAGRSYQVHFGSAAVTAIYVDATTISATSPSGSGDVAVTVRDTGNNTTATGSLTFAYQTMLQPGSFTAGYGVTQPIDLTSLVGPWAPYELILVNNTGPGTTLSYNTPTVNGGSVEIDAMTGIGTYRPPFNYRGPDSFYVAAIIGGTRSNFVTVTVTVGDPTITVTTSGSLKRGIAGSLDIRPSGGAGLYTCVLSSGAALPAGLVQSNSIYGDTGCRLSGTPSAAGTSTLQFDITDSSLGSGPFIVSGVPVAVAVAAAPPTITSLTPSGGNSAGGMTVTVSGTNFIAGATSVTIGGTVIPAADVTVASATSLRFTTPPHATGTVEVMVTTADGTSAAAPGGFTYVDPPVANAQSLTTAYLTALPVTLTASNAPTSFDIVADPAHGTLQGSGANRIYRPSADYAGPDSFTFTATNAGGTSVPVLVEIMIGKATQTIAFSNPGLVELGTTPTLTATATSTLPVAFTATTTSICTVSGQTLALLAPGTCTISADQAGNDIYDAAPSVSRSFAVVAPVLAITPGAVAGAQVGGNYSQANPASGGIAPYSYAVAAGALPAGTSLDAATGTVSGTPTAAGGINYRIKVTDSQGTPVTVTGAQVSGTIAKGNQTVAFTSTAPGLATVGGTPYNPAASASSGLGVTFMLDGASTGCALTGNTVTFTAAGTCRINANQAGDSNWNPATPVQQNFIIDAAGAVTTSASFTPGSIGVGSNGTLTLTFTNPNVSGTPDVAPLLSGSALLTRTGSVGGSCGATGSDAGASFQFNPFSIPSGSCTVTLDYTGVTAGASSGVVLGAFTPSGYPSTAATRGNSFVVVPTATSITPDNGPAGQVVTITGRGFSTTPGNNVVSFGSQTGTVTAASATSLTVTAPATGSGSVNVTVRINAQTSGSLVYTFLNPPIAADKPGIAVPYNSSGTTIDLAPSITGGSHDSITIGTPAQHGATSISGNEVIYIPTAGYYGADSFTYTATGPGGISNVATVSLTVATPAAPVVANATADVPYNSAGTTIDLTASITGVRTSIVIGTAPAHGNTTVAGDVVTYVPTAGYFGGDSFTYTATGPGGTSNIATVSLTVGNPPAPVAASKAGVAVPYGGTGTAIDLSGSITGVHTLIEIGTAPMYGTVSIAGDVVTYSPASTYFGADSFTYIATGPGGTSNAATVSLTVATPAAPVVANKADVAVPYASTDTAIDLSASISGVHTSIAVATAPAHGTVAIVGYVVTYTPTAGYFGADSFTYTATGPGGTSAPATVSLTVATPDAPAVTDKTGVAVPYNSSGTAIDLSSSIRGVHSLIQIGTAPAHGTVSIAGDVVTYTPTAAYYGADSFTFTATGPGGTSNASTVSLTVATPGAPVAANKSGVSVAYNSAGTAIDLSSSITGVHSLIQIGTAPAHGTVSIAGDVVTYTPTAAYFGADSFTYTATGPGGTSAAATVSLTVATPAPPAQAPGTGSVAGSSSVTSNNSVDIDLSALVTGVYGTIQIETPPAHGTVTLRVVGGQTTTGQGSEGVQRTLAAGRTIATYRPAVGYAGTDSFTFYATGPGGRSAAAAVSVTVVGSVPVTTPKTTTAGDGQMVSVELTTGATEGPFTGAAIVSVTPANAATTRIVDSGTGASRTFRLEVTPNARFSGNVVVTYTLTNAYGTSAPSTVTVAVTARPNPTADANVRGISDAQAETARRFARSQVANFMRRAEQLHGGGSGGQTMGVTLTSRDGRGMVRERPAFDASALEITERMRMSGNDPMLGQVANLRGSGGLRTDMLGSGSMAMTSGSPTPQRRAGAVERTVLSEDIEGGSGERKTGSVAIWSGGAIDIGTQDATTQRSKITATTSGLSAGADVKLADGVILGIGGGYGNDVSHIGGQAARVRSTSSLFAAYASVTPGGSAFVDGMIGIGDLSFSTRRAVATLNVNALGSRDGRFTVGALAAGIDSQGESLRWSLYGRGEFMNATLGSYSETGAGNMNLRFDERRVRSLTGTLGARIEFATEAGFAMVTPRLRAEWNHEFANGEAQFLDYADIPGAALFSFATQGWSRDQFQLTTGMRFKFHRGWSFDAEAGYRGGTGQQAGALRLQLSKEF